MSDEPIDETLRVRSLIQLGRYDEAAQLATSALAREPDRAELHALRADALIETSPKAALDPAQRAISLAPDDPEIMKTLVRAQWRADKNSNAIESVTRLRDMAPDAPEAHTWRAGILLSGKAYGRSGPPKKTVVEAEAAAREGIRLAPWWPNAHFMLAQVLNMSNRQPEARAAAEKALQLDPNFAPAHELIGDLHRSEGDVRLASEAYVRAGRADPNSEATSRLRQLQRPAAIAGAFTLYLVLRTLARVGRFGTTAAIVVVVVAALIVLGYVVYRRRRMATAREAMSDDARRILELDDQTRSSFWQRLRSRDR